MNNLIQIKLIVDHLTKEPLYPKTHAIGVGYTDKHGDCISVLEALDDLDNLFEVLSEYDLTLGHSENLAFPGNEGRELQNLINNKLDTLQSGVNIKTINDISVLGSGNIDIEPNGISSIVTLESGLSGGINTITITQGNGKLTTLNVKNGKDGANGVYINIDGEELDPEFSIEDNLISESSTNALSAKLGKILAHEIGLETEIYNEDSVEFVDGYWYTKTINEEIRENCNQNVNNLAHIYKCLQIEVKAGDVVNVKTRSTSANTCRPWMVLNLNRRVIAVSDQTSAEINLTLFIETDGYVCVNCVADTQDMDNWVNYVSNFKVEKITNNLDKQGAGVYAPYYKNNPLPQQKDTLKILAIGNSYSEDLLSYVPLLALEAGIPNDKLCIYRLYEGSASLQTWAENYENNISLPTPSPDRLCVEVTKLSSIKMVNKGSVSEILAQDWDIIILQQVSTKAGNYNTFNPYLTKLIYYIKRTCTNPLVCIAWQSVWSHNLATEALTLKSWKDICDATKKISHFDGINIVIPTGTAIQNARAYQKLHHTFNSGNPYGAFTRDDTHLEFGVGRYIAACTFFESIITPIFGISVLGNPATYTLTSSEIESNHNINGAENVTDSNKSICLLCAFAATINKWGITDITNISIDNILQTYSPSIYDRVTALESTSKLLEAHNLSFLETTNYNIDSLKKGTIWKINDNDNLEYDPIYKQANGQYGTIQLDVRAGDRVHIKSYSRGWAWAVVDEGWNILSIDADEGLHEVDTELNIYKNGRVFINCMYAIYNTIIHDNDGEITYENEFVRNYEDFEVIHYYNKVITDVDTLLKQVDKLSQNIDSEDMSITSYDQKSLNLMFVWKNEKSVNLVPRYISRNVNSGCMYLSVKAGDTVILDTQALSYPYYKPKNLATVQAIKNITSILDIENIRNNIIDVGAYRTVAWAITDTKRQIIDSAPLCTNKFPTQGGDESDETFIARFKDALLSPPDGSLPDGIVKTTLNIKLDGLVFLNCYKDYYDNFSVIHMSSKGKKMETNHLNLLYYGNTDVSSGHERRERWTPAQLRRVLSHTYHTGDKAGTTDWFFWTLGYIEAGSKNETIDGITNKYRFGCNVSSGGNAYNPSRKLDWEWLANRYFSEDYYSSGQWIESNQNYSESEHPNTIPEGLRAFETCIEHLKEELNNPPRRHKVVLTLPIPYYFPYYAISYKFKELVSDNEPISADNLPKLNENGTEKSPSSKVLVITNRNLLQAVKTFNKVNGLKYDVRLYGPWLDINESDKDKYLEEDGSIYYTTETFNREDLNGDPITTYINYKLWSNLDTLNPVPDGATEVPMKGLEGWGKLEKNDIPSYNNGFTEEDPWKSIFGEYDALLFDVAKEDVDENSISKSIEPFFILNNIVNEDSDNNRIILMKWYIDKLISEFNNKQYLNFDLAGFMWIDENISYPAPEESSWSATVYDRIIGEIGKYIQDKGYRLYWIPYATGDGRFEDGLNVTDRYIQTGYFWKNLGETDTVTLPNGTTTSIDVSVSNTTSNMTKEVMKSIYKEAVDLYDMGVEYEVDSALFRKRIDHSEGTSGIRYGVNLKDTLEPLYEDGFTPPDLSIVSDSLMDRLVTLTDVFEDENYFKDRIIAYYFDNNMQLMMELSDNPRVQDLMDRLAYLITSDDTNASYNLKLRTITNRVTSLENSLEDLENSLETFSPILHEEIYSSGELMANKMYDFGEITDNLIIPNLSDDNLVSNAVNLWTLRFKVGDLSETELSVTLPNGVIGNIPPLHTNDYVEITITKHTINDTTNYYANAKVWSTN